MKKHDINKLVRWLAIGACGAAFMLGIILTSPLRQETQAVSFSSTGCLNSSGADKVGSVQRVCTEQCPSSSGASLGTLWINGSSSQKNSDVIEVPNSSVSRITAYMWGQVFACKVDRTNRTNQALYIWFGEKDYDEDANNDAKKVDFIENNNANSQLKLYRGIGGERNTWYSTNNNNKVEININVDKFKAYVESGKGTKTVEGDYTIYSTMVSVNRCFDNTYGRYKKSSTCYGDNSTIAMKIRNTAESKFWSSSQGSATSVVDGSFIENIFYTSVDSDAERTASTSDNKAQVNLFHHIGYDKPVATGTYEPATTHWKINVTANGKTLSDALADGTVYNHINGDSEGDWTYGQDGKESFDRGSNIYVNIPTGGFVKVCSTISYNPKNIKWKENPSGSSNYKKETTSGSEDSTVCVTVKNGGTIVGQGAEFTSQSSVKLSSSGEDTSGVDGMLSNQDPKVEEAKQAKGNAGFREGGIGINDSSVEIELWHNITYTVPQSLFASADVVSAPGLETIWTVETKYKKLGKIKADGTYESRSGWMWVSNGNYKGSFKPQNVKNTEVSGNIASTLGSSKITMNLDKGETVLVCSTISYQPKKITFKQTGHSDGRLGHDIDHINYTYGIDQSGGGASSQACAVVNRMIEPQGTPWSGTPNPSLMGLGGSAASEIMYAGEETPIGWTIHASGNLYNRLTKVQLFNYSMVANTAYTSNILDGGTILADTGGPCTFVQSLLLNGGQCNVIDTFNVFRGGENSFDSYLLWNRDTQENIISPNEVGLKHGNSAAYHYEVWKWMQCCDDCGSTSDGQGGEVCNTCLHHHDTSEDYWHVFNTAARTVVKKPSIAFWNGGVSTGASSVEASLAKRYSNASGIVHELVSGNPTYFGSWAEYLAVVGSSVRNFTSGASLAMGLGVPPDFNILLNSPLTITNNTSTVGYASIASNGILRERLQQYFFNSQTINNQSGASVDVDRHTGNYTLGGGSYDSKTTIITVDGDLEIAGNIETRTNSVSTIYDLPQVLIYATGDIKIKSNVTRIDAWLVTDKTLYTCGDFSDGVTEAGINGYTGHNECSKYLQINGPVFAKKLVARRTYGADGISNNDTDTAGGSDTRAATAEAFNLSAMSYIWAYAQGGRYNSSYTEAYSRELPPRY